MLISFTDIAKISAFLILVRTTLAINTSHRSYSLLAFDTLVKMIIRHFDLK